MIGRYVGYKNKGGIIVGTNINNQPHLVQVLFKDQTKLVINKNNLVVRREYCEIVNFGDTYYLVSPKKTIISLDTKRIMMWSDEHRERHEILELAGM